MFRKTDANPRLDLLTAPGNILPKRARKKYTDEKACHNRFFKSVTSQIDEEAFKPLFEETEMGAPNASVRILVAMSILKEGFGCSDHDLFEKCEFDLPARKALGLEMLDDKTPSLDAYYLFGRRLTDYEQRTGINLMERCFEQVTGEQIKLSKISGNSVRMDGKLIGSNIARYTRYELIHRTLCKALREESIMMMLTPSSLIIKEDIQDSRERRKEKVLIILEATKSNFLSPTKNLPPTSPELGNDITGKKLGIRTCHIHLRILDVKVRVQHVLELWNHLYLVKQYVELLFISHLTSIYSSKASGSRSFLLRLSSRFTSMI